MPRANGTRKLTVTIVALAAVALASVCFAQSEAKPNESSARSSQDLRDFVPATISPEARAIFQKLLPMVDAHRNEYTILKTLADFDANYAKILARAEANTAPLVKKLGVSNAELAIGGVRVYETRPPNYHDDGTVLIRVHGGGFIQDSAHSSAGADALMATATGRRVVSVDYTVAPRGRWQLVTDQVIAVYKGVLAEGYKPQSIGMFGDSAGANIVPASILKLRDNGSPMPGAVVLLSPCVDLNLNGDTETTLAHADPVLEVDRVIPGFKAYADPADWKNPYVSPIYGDFKKGFPPVLIQVGTKELLLSDSVRLYQAIKITGGEAELDVYEGMPHVFQAYLMNTPEQKAAYAEIQRFWSLHLEPTKR